jgi:hypothetical protein
MIMMRGPFPCRFFNPACSFPPCRRFLMASSDSESEDERRVVRSAKDKATVELAGICGEIRVRS